MNPRLLVIGYGNPLRRDDGLGPFVADKITGWQLAGVRVLVVQQLVPELAEELWELERVLFIDASCDTNSVTLCKLRPAPSLPRLGHTGAPGYILALTESLHGRCPAAWHLTLPASDLGFGEGLSSFAQEQANLALRWLKDWVQVGLTLAEAGSCTKLD